MYALELTKAKQIVLVSEVAFSCHLGIPKRM
uniref:Uncharacterized protein n=1 Tax=Lepeophtheirus salmonis TaxID=72036 RepID=A0A0K2TBB6_LEPSM